MYVNTYLGYFWAAINPLATMLVLAFAFGAIGKIDTGATPYILFTLAGTIGWNYIAVVTNEAGRSMMNARDMITKIYFPKLVIPLSKAAMALAELGVSLICLLVLMLIFQYPPHYTLLLFPVFLTALIGTGLMMGIWFSALTVQYRDFYFVVPFLLRLGLFITPIAFPVSAVPEAYRLFFYLNPLTGPVEGLRWCLLGGYALSPFVLISFFMVFLLFWSGVWYFRRVEHTIADII